LPPSTPVLLLALLLSVFLLPFRLVAIVLNS
jgi:hypothetical protein